MAPRILQIAQGSSEPMRVHCRQPGPTFNREGDRKQAAHGQALGPWPSGRVASPSNPLPCRTPRRADRSRHARAAHAGAVFLAPQQRTSTSLSGATAADSPSNRSPCSSQHRRIRMDLPSVSARRFPAIRLLDRERGRPSRPRGGAVRPNRCRELAGTCRPGRRSRHSRRACRFLDGLQRRLAPQGLHGCRRLG